MKPRIRFRRVIACLFLIWIVMGTLVYHVRIASTVYHAHRDAIHALLSGFGLPGG